MGGPEPAPYGSGAGAAARGDRARTAAAHAAASWLSMLRWAAGLLPPPARARAVAELDATGLSVAAAPFYPVRHGMRAALHDTRPVDERQGPSGRELVAALRSVETAVDGDRLLDAARVDWDVLAAAHARDPFPSVPSRALIARRDCPDPFIVALLTPWRVEVANRIAARQKNRTGPAERRSAYRAHTAPLVHCHDLSDEIRKVLLPHVSHLRTPLLRLLLAPGKAREVVRATARLDRLLAAVDHGDHGHLPRIQAFWDAVGAELRDTLGEDRTAWTAVARRLTRHKGSLRELLDTLGDPVPGSRKHGPDLRVLIQAPPSVLTAIVADLDDAALERAAERYVGDDRVRTADGLLVTALAQLERAGVAPRRPFARWAHGALAHRPGELAEVAWLYGGSPDLDGSLIRLARLRPDLRRRLAAAHAQPPPAVDPVAELREQHDAVRAQLVLDSSCPDDTPWPRLLEAHAAEPLPEPVLWVLASRPGFPAVLARALPGARTEDLAAQGADAARHALAHLAGRSPGDVLDHLHASTAGATIHSIRARGTLDDRTVLDTARPAAVPLLYGRGLLPGDRSRDAWNSACAELFTDAARRFGPGFWHCLAHRLPICEGTLPELLAPRPGDALASRLHRLAENPNRLAENPGEPAGTSPVHVLLERYEERVRAATALLHPDADLPGAYGPPDVRRSPDAHGSPGIHAFPDREAALRLLDAEGENLPLVARVASTVRPGLAIALPRLVAPYLRERGRIAELVPLAESARRTAARVADCRGEADAEAALGRALFLLGRYEEGVPACERALALFHDIGGPHGAARTSRDLGRVLLFLHRFPEAATVLERSRPLCREADLPLLEGNVCLLLGHALRHLGRTAEAATAYRDAVALLDGNGDGSGDGSGRERALDAAKRELDRLTADPT
ncbi:tetratricopeptide repeat protein [Streptomyces cinereoruber]|uniref:tetratricopeptide repeat protein n=1 Tax=Streptomyces cinereoruber TaxID=67260 RepID=UPI0036430B3E